MLPNDLTHLVGKLPAQGNSTDTSNDELTPEQKLAEAERLLEEQKKQQQQQQTDELTDEQIQAKLDDLAQKDETTLTKEEKEFIQKYVPEDDEVTSIKKDIISTYGIELEDTFENNPAGLKKLTETVTPKIAEKIFLNALATVPHMAEFYQHVTSGKSIDTFLQKNIKPAFESIEVREVSDTDNDEVRDKITNNYKTLISMSLREKGLSETDAQNLIDLYESKGELYNKAKESKVELNTKHKALIDAKLKEEEDRIANEAKELQETIKKAQQVVDSNNFAGISIPSTDLAQFKAALFKTDQNGNSLIDYKRSKLSLEQRLLIDYIVFKDFKGIGTTASNAIQAKQFTFSKANKDNQARGGSRVSNSGNPSFNLKDVDFSQVMKQQ